MTTLYIANNRTPDLVGDLSEHSEGALRYGASHIQRLLWSLEDGDVLVLPQHPGDSFVEYVTRLTGTDRSTITVVVPPVTDASVSADVLSADRLLHHGFLAELRTVVGQGLQRILPCYADPITAALSAALDATDRFPGYAFNSQGGATAVNSKAIFRALVSAVGLPIPEGTAVSDKHLAALAIERMLDDDGPVMLKREFFAGGYGNEVIARTADVEPVGARHRVVIGDRGELNDYLDRRWIWLTGNGAHRLVIERFHPGAVPLYVDQVLTEDGVEHLGHGQMIAEPLATGTICPAPALSHDKLAELEDIARRAGETYHRMGYRGYLGPDAILTARQEILLCEVNGRITGTNFLHTAVLGRLVGPNARGARIVADGEDWKVPSFDAAVDRLASTGLAFDQNTKQGVVVICDLVRAVGTVLYCIVAPDAESVAELRRRMDELF